MTAPQTGLKRIAQSLGRIVSYPDVKAVTRAALHVNTPLLNHASGDKTGAE